jgi:hypothetical protein
MNEHHQSPKDVLAAVDLDSTLRAAEDEVDRLRKELQRIKSSAAYQVGGVLSEAARHPASAPRNLFNLYRRWRRTGSRSPVSATRQVGADATESAQLLADLVPLTVMRRELPVVAGVLHPATRRTLEPSADVVAMAPTSGRWLLDRIRPDVLIVDSSAGLSGPWAQLGTYAAPDRARDLLELLHVARQLAVPTVAWRSIQPSTTPLFLDAENAFDLVLDLESADPARGWHPGVQLRNSNPIAGGDRPTGPMDALAQGEPVTVEVPELLQDLPVDRPRNATEQRRILRVIFAHYATPVMLARLLAAVEIDYEMTGRAVSLHVRASQVDDRALVDSVLAQAHRPREVVVTGAAEAAEWTVAALRAAGVPARIRSGGRADAGASVRDMVADAVAPLVAVRTRPLADEYELADLVLAAECTDADAVGYTEEDFTFVHSLPLEGCLVRRDAAKTSGRPDGPSLSVESGLRLLGISRVGSAR